MVQRVLKLSLFRHGRMTRMRDKRTVRWDGSRYRVSCFRLHGYGRLERIELRRADDQSSFVQPYTSSYFKECVHSIVTPVSAHCNPVQVGLVHACVGNLAEYAGTQAYLPLVTGRELKGSALNRQNAQKHFLPNSHHNNQAQNEYNHSLTFRMRRYVVIATKSVHRLQIRQIVHNQRAPSIPFPQVTSGYVRQCWHAARYRCRDSHTDTQTAVTAIHFASSTTNAKCKYKQHHSKMIEEIIRVQISE